MMAQPELIKNGGFEDSAPPSLSPWVVNFGTAVSTTAGLPHEGLQFAFLSPNTKISQKIRPGLASGRIYRLTLNFSSPGAIDNSLTTVRLKFTNSADAVLQTVEFFVGQNTQPANANGTWNFHQFLSPLSPVGTVGAIVEIETGNGAVYGNGIYVDDVSLVQENQN